MINKRIISVFALLLCFALYDTLVKKAQGFPVNLVAFFYCSLYCFIAFVLWDWRKSERNKFDRKILTVAILPFLLRIILNLLSINQSREVYNNLVSNQYIDYFSWITLMGILIIMLWQKYIV